MAERNSVLEKERSKYVKIGTDFSDQCRTLKQALQSITLDVKELQSEIEFLDE
jgi:hypothetical protein